MTDLSTCGLFGLVLCADGGLFRLQRRYREEVQRTGELRVRGHRTLALEEDVRRTGQRCETYRACRSQRYCTPLLVDLVLSSYTASTPNTAVLIRVESPT